MKPAPQLSKADSKREVFIHSSQDKFDPAALNRWKHSQDEDSHVTAEAEITQSPVESPSGANLALREVNPSPSTSTADMSLYSFEEILLKTMKSRGTQVSVKPTKTYCSRG